MTTSPADELRQAAATLEKLLAALPVDQWNGRPWHAEECSDTDDMTPCPCIVAQGEYRDFDQPQDPPIQYVADAENPEFAAFIAAMHPGVGAALAKWLDSWTGIDLYEAGSLPEDAKHALAVARQINAASA
jgi:hypothetical protein